MSHMRRPRARRVHPVMILVVMLVGCESQFARLQRTLSEAQREEQTRLGQMELPLYIEGEFEEPPPAISVTVEPTRLILDNARLLHARIAAMAALDRHAFFESAWETHSGRKPLVRIELAVPLDEDGIQALREAARRAREVAEHLQPASPSSSTPIVVHAAPRVSFGTVVEVANLLSREAAVRLVVARGGKTHAINLDTPPACYTSLELEGVAGGEVVPDTRKLTCVEPRLTLDARGMTVEALAAPQQDTRMVARCAVHSRHPGVPAPVMIPEHDDLLGNLSAELSRQWRVLPPCESVVVRADGTIPWQRIARLVQRLRAIGRHHPHPGGVPAPLDNIQLALAPATVSR